MFSYTPTVTLATCLVQIMKYGKMKDHNTTCHKWHWQGIVDYPPIFVIFYYPYIYTNKGRHIFTEVTWNPINWIHVICRKFYMAQLPIHWSFKKVYCSPSIATICLSVDHKMKVAEPPMIMEKWKFTIWIIIKPGLWT